MKHCCYCTASKYTSTCNIPKTLNYINAFTLKGPQCWPDRLYIFCQLNQLTSHFTVSNKALFFPGLLPVIKALLMNKVLSQTHNEWIYVADSRHWKFFSELSGEAPPPSLSLEEHSSYSLCPKHQSTFLFSVTSENVVCSHRKSQVYFGYQPDYMWCSMVLIRWSVLLTDTTVPQTQRIMEMKELVTAGNYYGFAQMWWDNFRNISENKRRNIKAFWERLI